MTRTALAALLLLLVAPPAAAQRSPSFFITHSSTTDRRTPGTASSEADAAASFMMNTLGQALQDRYPCATTLTDSEAGALVGWEKNRQVLGASQTDERLIAYAGSVGAGTLVTVQVGEAGGNFSATVVVMDTRSARVVSRKSLTVKADDDAIDSLEAMAKEVAQGLGGFGCKQTDWAGTVTVNEQFSGSAPTESGETMAGSKSMSLNCQLDGTSGAEATCTVTYTSTMAFSGGTKVKETAQDKVTCSVTVDATSKSTRLTFGMIRLKTQQDATLVMKDQDGKVTSVSNQGPGEVQLGSWEFEGAARPVGNGTVSGTGRFGNAVANWNLRPPPGS